MKKIYIIIAIVLVVLIIGAVVYSGDGQPKLSPEEIAEIQLQREGEVGVDSSRTATRYVHPQFGFSFEKPEGYTIGVIPDGEDAQTVVVQNANSGNAEDGFQVYIYPTDEQVQLTPQLIQSDLPGTVVNNAQKIVLDDAPGMMFESNNEHFGGSSFEIWFVREGYVYQISSYGAYASDLQGIIGTWKF